MDVKEAVKKAKEFVIDVLGDEGISGLGLEEVRFSPSEVAWHITLGFSRPWDHMRGAAAVINGGASARSYKILIVDDESGVIKSMQDWVRPKN